MSLVQDDFSNLSGFASEKFLKEGVPLNDTILKIAEERDLNPDQIKRLVEGANVKTFLGMHKVAYKNGENVDFDVADTHAILGKYYKGTKTAQTVKTASLNVDGTPDEFELDLPMNSQRQGAAHVSDTFDYQEKVAEEAPRVRKEVMVFRLQKVAENFKEQIFAEEHSYIEKLEKLAAMFRPLYGPSYESFEKEARSHFGDQMDHVLLDLRRELKKGGELGEIEKVAHTLILDYPKELGTLESMYENKSNQIKYANGYKLAHEQLKRLR